MWTSSAEAAGLGLEAVAADGRAGPVSVRTPPSTTIPPLAGSKTAEWPERTLGEKARRASAFGGSLHERLGVCRMERDSPPPVGAHPIT